MYVFKEVLPGTHMVGSVLMPISLMRKLRSKVVSKYMQGHIVSGRVNI